MKKLSLLFALLCVNLMGWAVDWTGSVSGTADNVWATSNPQTYSDGVAYTINYLAEYNDVSKGLTVSFELAGDILSMDAYVNHTVGSPNMYIRSTNTFYSVTNYECTLPGPYEPGDVVTAEFHITYNAKEIYREFSYTIPNSGSSTPVVTGICESTVYTSNVAGYDIHAMVTKGCNKYYLTISSATEGKTITELVGDNMFCNRYCDEARTHNNNYHMAAAGHYTLTDGKVIFTIPSVGDPKMYTPLYLRFNDNQAVEVTALNGVRLEPCSTESLADCPDPDPTAIEDVNFALMSNGAVAYASSGNAWEAIDGNDGSRWESASSDPQWYVVDLGQRRIFNTVQIRWQTAYSRTFTIDVSNDGENWTTKKTEANYTDGGDNVEYEANFAENITARYVRLSSTARATQWGNSFFSFRVLLKGVPVLTSVDLSSNTTIAKVGEYATLTASPKDQNNGAIAASLSYTVTPSDAGHVTDNKYYPEKYGLATITVTATTANAEVTSNSVEVWGVLGDNLAYSSNITTDNKVIDQSEVTGDATSAFYAVDGNKGSTWQACRDLNDNKSNANFTSYYTLDLGNVYAINLIAIWFDGAASDEYTIEFSKDNTAWSTGFSISQHIGNYTHQKYLSIADLNNNDQARYVRFTTTKASTTNGWGMKMFEMEVYGTEASTKKIVSATVQPAGTGSATVTNTETGDPVDEVDAGTSVTFTATPAAGYDFVNWTQGGVVVPGAGATYTTTITANTALVANFEAARTAYCGTSITDNAHNNTTLYVSITNPSGNTYKIMVEGTATNRIESAYNNFNFVLSHINGESGNTALPASSWTIDNTGYGSAYVTFTADDFREITYANNNKYIVLNKQGGGLMEFSAFPDVNLIQWSATCIDSDAPVLEAPVATPIGATSVRLDLMATDLVAGLLTYHVNYKPTGDTGAGENINILGASGETTSKTITGLTNGVEYTFSVTVTDGTNESAAQVCTATPAMSTAPVPTANAKYVLSVYSDAYETALAHDFSKNTWTGIPYTELDINGDHALAYTNPSSPAQMPDVAWGMNDNNNNAIIALDEFNDGTNKGLDVRGMTYIHFDIWSTTATTYPELRLNDTEAGHFSLNGNGWQSFDLNISTLTNEQKSNIRWIKFIALRDPAPDQIVIDNVYFYAVPEDISFVDNGSNVDLIEAKHKHFVNATINRSFAANDEWYTLCLPFDLDAAKINEVFGASTIAEMVGAEDRGSLIHLNFDYINEIKAGKAYLFKPGNDFAAGTTIEGVQIKNVNPATLKSTNTYMEFQGTFESILLNSDNQRFVGPENYLYSPAANGTTMKAFRCYFTIPNNAPNNVISKRAKIVFGPQATTDIENAQDNVQCTKVLRDGQLYIIRDGRTYDAQGQLIK